MNTDVITYHVYLLTSCYDAINGFMRFHEIFEVVSPVQIQYLHSHTSCGVPMCCLHQCTSVYIQVVKVNTAIVNLTWKRPKRILTYKYDSTELAKKQM